MGVQGLLPALKPITDRCHLDTLRGQTVAVDAYSWLHKATYASSASLFHSLPCTGHIDYCMGRVRGLLHHDIRVILVFDGGHLPGKAGRELERREAREKARMQAHQLLALGKLKEASAFVNKAIDVTPEMAKQWIDRVKQMNDARIEVIVAPYEADAQMAYLERIGRVSAVLSEDSDLLVFGVRRLCCKLDPRTGYFETVRGGWEGAVRELFGGLSADPTCAALDKLRQLAALAGCDYVTQGVAGVGLKTAQRYLMKYGTMSRVVQVWRAEGRSIPDSFLEDCYKAVLCFAHQIVYCPEKQECVHCTPIDEHSESIILGELSWLCASPGDLGFLGAVLEKDVIIGIANGQLHPETKQPFAVIQCEEKENTRVPVVNSTSAMHVKKRAIASLYNLDSTNQTTIVTTTKKKKTIKDYFL